MEESKIKPNNAYLEEVHKNFKLIQQIHKFEDQSINIWHNINANIIDLWPFIQIIFEHEKFVRRVKVGIKQTRTDMDHRLEGAHKMINILNSKTKEELEEVNIQDITEVVMEAKIVLTKNNFMVQLENKYKEPEL